MILLDFTTVVSPETDSHPFPAAHASRSFASLASSHRCRILSSSGLRTRSEFLRESRSRFHTEIDAFVVRPTTRHHCFDFGPHPPAAKPPRQPIVQASDLLKSDL